MDAVCGICSASLSELSVRLFAQIPKDFHPMEEKCMVSPEQASAVPSILMRKAPRDLK